MFTFRWILYLNLHRYTGLYVAHHNVLFGKCLFGQRPRAHPPSSNRAHIHRAKKCLFQTHHQSPSGMTRNNYLIFVLIGWLPGCGYISARGKRNNIPSVCARIYERQRDTLQVLCWVFQVDSALDRWP